MQSGLACRGATVLGSVGIGAIQRAYFQGDILDRELNIEKQQGSQVFTGHREQSKNISTFQFIEETKKGPKSSLRIQYDAEKKVILSKIGDLEAIRKDLNLSKRKMAQLLMVDPSAWTRWTTGGGQAPHSVYRTLQWYLALIEKEPAWHPANSFNRYNSLRGDKAISMENQVHLLQDKVKALELEAKEQFLTFKRLRASYFSLFLCMFVIVLAVAYFS